MRIAITLVSLSLAVSALAGNVYTRTANGVTVAVKHHLAGQTALVRLQVMGDKIIRVSATAENSFADPKSLIVIPHNRQQRYTITEKGDVVTVATKSVRANVNGVTGEVWFTDSNGKTILQERKGGGKHFKPYTATQIHPDGKPETYRGWTIHQEFESPADEAFYGLGQHQADEWNYKGRDEELFQYNTKVSIPFVVSNYNYGLLLDSYSLCRFGNPNDYSQLHRLFDIADTEGKPGAFTGIYTHAMHETYVRREDSIYFENLKTAKNLPNFVLDGAHVTYEGTITPHETGEYRFCHYYSGYQRIYIDDKPVYTEDLTASGKQDQTIWRTAWNPNARKFRLNLRKGQTYKFRLEWDPDGGEAYCGVRAYPPVDNETQQRQSWWSEMTQQLDYYFIAGDNADEIISGYRTLTGKAQVMPAWLLGYWQSRERYKTQDEIVDALKGFRQRRLPIDNIVMDWNYWTPDQWGAFTFDPSRFSSPKKMIDDIHSMNAKIMISCWPKYYLGVDNYKELLAKDMIYMQSVKDSLIDWLGYPYAFYDAYDEGARRIFWRQLYERLATIGMDAWWMDASEPNVRDCTDMDYRKLLCGPTKYGSSDEFFNAYSIVNAEAIYDGQRAYETAVEQNAIDPADSHKLDAVATWNQDGHSNKFSPENKRVFLLTRNGFASEQRYSTATWSGDIGTRWEDLKAQITAGLNFSISGVPYWSQDIGGFSVERRYQEAQQWFDKTGKTNSDLLEWRELNVRWHQMGMWAPMYRSHGQFPYREPWNISPEGTLAYRVIQSCLELRYRLMPYIYSLAGKVHFDDYTIMRPLIMDFAHDKAVTDIAYQFMFGPSIMVCPIYKYKAREREVYFPEGETWYDMFTGNVASGGGETKTVSAPIEHIPVYVRGGSILPLGPRIEYTGEKKPEHIRLFIYEGKDGDFTLYEDEQTNYGYEAGRYSTIPVHYDDKRHEVTIGQREGSFPGMLQKRKFTIVMVNATNSQPINPTAEGIEVDYKGKAVVVKTTR
ncbi:MAG: DUF5110 domain-containing protein [Bacteroidales bacterium]|nr:DUF5110 domain-containing protein [Bacteroidales bacterium]